MIVFIFVCVAINCPDRLLTSTSLQCLTYKQMTSHFHLYVISSSIKHALDLE